jgi:hypothetical protein
MRILVFLALFCPALLFGQTVRQRTTDTVDGVKKAKSDSTESFKKATQESIDAFKRATSETTENIKTATGEIVTRIIGEYPRTPKEGDWIAVRLEQGYMNSGLNIKQPRDIVGQAIFIQDGKALLRGVRIKVIGGTVDHLDLPLTNAAHVTGWPQNLESVTKEPYKEKNFQLPAGHRVNMLETAIVFNKKGQPKFGALAHFDSDIRSLPDDKEDHTSNHRAEDDQTPVFIPLDSLTTRIPPRLERPPMRNIVSQGFVEAWEWLDESYDHRFSNQKNTVIRALQGVFSSDCAPTASARIEGPEINLASKNTTYIGWPEFLNEIASMLGKKVDNCSLKNNAHYGALMLEAEKSLIKKFEDKLEFERRIPDNKSDIIPEKIAAADVCARTCYAEMSTEPCFGENGKFDPRYFKAVAATIYNRGKMISKTDTAYREAINNRLKSTEKKDQAWRQNKGKQLGSSIGPINYANRLDIKQKSGMGYPGFESAGYMPNQAADIVAFTNLNGRGLSSHMNLLEDPMIEASLNGRQYNNWQDNSTFIKSICPALKPNPEYSKYMALPKNKRTPPAPPQFVDQNSDHVQARNACNKFCAQAAFKPDDFEKQNLCGFDKNSFSSNQELCRDFFDGDNGLKVCPTVPGCYPMERFDNRTREERRKPLVPICDEQGKPVEAFKKECTRFWFEKKAGDGCLH